MHNELSPINPNSSIYGKYSELAIKIFGWQADAYPNNDRLCDPPTEGATCISCMFQRGCGTPRILLTDDGQPTNY